MSYILYISRSIFEILMPVLLFLLLPYCKSDQDILKVTVVERKVPASGDIFTAAMSVSVLMSTSCQVGLCSGSILIF